MDPHHEGEHKHVIVSLFTLTGVLFALLGLTALTMGASYVEKWIAQTWEFEIPQIVNAIIAMSIACVKGLLVCLFFMQLKYDNKINSVVMGFTLFAVTLFLTFTGIDLANRNTVYDYHSGEKQVGGMGITVTNGVNTGTTPIVQYWREKKLEEVGEAEFKRLEEEAHKKAGKHHDHGPTFSNASKQVKRSGLTPGLFDPEAPESIRPHEHQSLNR